MDNFKIAAILTDYTNIDTALAHAVRFSLNGPENENHFDIVDLREKKENVIDIESVINSWISHGFSQKLKKINVGYLDFNTAKNSEVSLPGRKNYDLTICELNPFRFLIDLMYKRNFYKIFFELSKSMLVIPARAKHIVNKYTGVSSLSSVVMEINSFSDQFNLFSAVKKIGGLLETEKKDIIIYGMTTEEEFPYVSVSFLEDIIWKEVIRKGSIEKSIISVANMKNVDMIALDINLNGKRGLRDKKSLFEKLLRKSIVPFLLVD